MERCRLCTIIYSGGFHHVATVIGLASHIRKLTFSITDNYILKQKNNDVEFVRLKMFTGGGGGGGGDGTVCGRQVVCRYGMLSG